MKSSESIKNLTKALLKAQTQMGAAVKGSKNPFFKSNYADLPTVMEVVKSPLNENGILVLQLGEYDSSSGKNFIVTTLFHAESGEYLQGQTEVVYTKIGDAQAFGAAQTYARRFGLQSMLFIPSEDDDGNYASGKTNAQGKVPSVSTPYINTQQYRGINEQNTTSSVQNASTLLNVMVGSGEKTNPVAEMAADPTPTAQVEPLKKSSFRKGKKEATVTSVSNGDGWEQ
jgi:hypothetical protein